MKEFARFSQSVAQTREVHQSSPDFCKIMRGVSHERVKSVEAFVVLYLFRLSVRKLYVSINKPIKSEVSFSQ
jgi:hypothetical protein